MPWVPWVVGRMSRVAVVPWVVGVGVPVVHMRVLSGRVAVVTMMVAVAGVAGVVHHGGCACTGAHPVGGGAVLGHARGRGQQRLHLHGHAQHGARPLQQIGPTRTMGSMGGQAKGEVAGADCDAGHGDQGG